MITKIQGEQPFQVLTNNFSISPSQEGYTLQISADGKQYSNLFSVGAGVTRLVTGVAANSYYRLLGNNSQVSINWMKTCVTDGGGGNAGELEPVTEFPLGAAEGTVVALVSGDTMGVYQYDGEEWIPVACDMSQYALAADVNDFERVTATALTELHDSILDIEDAIETKEEVVASAITELHNQVLEISGSTGGGGFVELTKAEYEALDPPQSGVTYIITDADVVDLDDYALVSGLTELSAATITALDTKADAANVTANNSTRYFPRWNEQGIITGTVDQAYEYNVNMNGSSVTNIMNSGYGGFSFYAPTSAGTSGQPLLSNGSGAPVWGGYKFAFLSQTQYDALATKDATTIYFITGD